MAGPTFNREESIDSLAGMMINISGMLSALIPGKKYLFPPQATVATAEMTENGWRMETPSDEQPQYAFLGVRACELAAIKIQDRVFLDGPYVDSIYAKRRKDALIVAVNCTQAASTCFCSSMGTGPRCSSGFDLSLTELADGFIIEVGSPLGADVIASLETVNVSDDQSSEAEQRRQQAVTQQVRKLDPDFARETLLANLEHAHWDEVGQECLGCTNCTMVCPTCFCSSVEEVPDLSGQKVERQRHWDSCFNLGFSYMSHGTVRKSITHRYRQWLTHKLGTWQEQFDTSGCVGCGRCITWCPVGIDLVEEVQILSQPASVGSQGDA